MPLMLRHIFQPAAAAYMMFDIDSALLLMLLQSHDTRHIFRCHAAAAIFIAIDAISCFVIFTTFSLRCRCHYAMLMLDAAYADALFCLFSAIFTLILMFSPPTLLLLPFFRFSLSLLFARLMP